MLTHTEKDNALALAERRFTQRKAKRPRSLLSITDLGAIELKHLIECGIEMKRGGAAVDFNGRSLALLFQKTSTRTRCSFERAAAGLGMTATYIDWRTSNFVLADMQDEAIVLSRYYDVIVARLHDHALLKIMAAHSEVPVINGMCEREHPCEALGDFMTLAEYFGPRLDGLRMAYIGDGNNICRSLALGAARLGIRMTLCSPDGYRLDQQTTAAAGSTYVASPTEAVREADVIYTDTWISIGQESEAAIRRAAFAPFQVGEELLSAAAPHALVMHCLPAHPEQEITAALLRSPRSIVFDQAENRVYAQKALLEWLLGQGAAAAERAYGRD